MKYSIQNEAMPGRLMYKPFLIPDPEPCGVCGAPAVGYVCDSKPGMHRHFETCEACIDKIMEFAALSRMVRE